MSIMKCYSKWSLPVGIPVFIGLALIHTTLEFSHLIPPEHQTNNVHQRFDLERCPHSYQVQNLTSHDVNVYPGIKKNRLIQLNYGYTHTDKADECLYI